MATIQKKIKGFVLLNINTDEYSFLNPIKEEGNKSTSNVGSAGRSAATVVKSEDKLPISIETFLWRIGVTEEAIKNIHIQGSRLYGTSNSGSDWDIVAIADREVPFVFLEFTENGNNFDVRLFNTQEFKKTLDEHDIPSLEFIFHPESVIVLDKESYSLNLNTETLINNALAESKKQWNIAKSIINDPAADVYKGLKRVWHSLRYLIFAEQILKYGKITNFSAANSFYADIINSTFTDFSYFETNFLPIRIQLEDKIKSYLINSGGKSINTNSGPNPNSGPITGPPADISFGTGTVGIVDSGVVGTVGTVGSGTVVLNAGSGTVGGGTAIVDSGSSTVGSSTVGSGMIGVETIVLGV